MKTLSNPDAITVKSKAWGRLNIYQIGERGYAYNPTVGQWELYDMHADGSIQDIRGFVDFKQSAEVWARAIH